MAIKAHALDHHSAILSKLPPPQPVGAGDPFTTCLRQCDLSVTDLCSAITNEEFATAIATAIAADKAPGDDHVRAPHIKSPGPKALRLLHELISRIGMT
jgi:hypothetical protein